MSLALQAYLLAASAATAAASCAYGTSLMPRAEGGEITVNTFGYAGTIGPANWHALNTTTNMACATGTTQSPIDLVDGSFTELAGSKLTVDIPDFAAGATFENLGTTVEVVGEGGSLVIPSRNKTFEFAQFHFHLPSEHLDNGTSQAMEVHFVFQAADTEIAVLGVYIDVQAAATQAAATKFKRQNSKTSSSTKKRSPKTDGKSKCESTAADDTAAGEYTTADGAESSDATTSSTLETLFASVGEIATPGTATTTQALAMSEIVSLLQSTTFKTYSGSLTTPPCSEGVNWHVATDTLSVSLETYKAARDVIGYNSRFPQGDLGQQNVLAAAAASIATA